MKFSRQLPIFSLVATSVVISSCGAVNNMIDKTRNRINQPISETGFNPLDKPGMKSRNSAYKTDSLVNSNNHGFNNGDIVEVVIPNTALFAKVPKSGDRYKQVLNLGDTLRVIGGEKEFIKVVTEKGVTGYVSSVMVVTHGSLTNKPKKSKSKSKSKSKPRKVTKRKKSIKPDKAPDPVVKGIGSTSTPSVAPTTIPDIASPVDVDPGLSVPDAPFVPHPALEIPKPGLTVPDSPVVPDMPLIPNSEPIVPSLPALSPDPVSPGLPE